MKAGRKAAVGFDPFAVGQAEIQQHDIEHVPCSRRESLAQGRHRIEPDRSISQELTYLQRVAWIVFDQERA